MQDDACDALHAMATRERDAAPPSNALAAAASPGRRERTCDGNLRAVLHHAAAHARASRDAVLAVVLETEGSTYARTGSMAVFTDARHVGWLSGGCLEPEVHRQAAIAAETRALRWLEIDTRDDAALFSGAATGCRGRLRIALLPLQRLPGLADLLVAWDEGRDALALRVDASGQVRLAVGNRDRAWRVPASPPPWPLRDLPAWELRIGRPPAVLIAGSGPEAPLLLPLLDQLGWRCVVAEPRDRWRAAHLADVGHRGAAFERLQDALDAAPPLDAALVMHHNFEMDREALETLSRTPVPFIGLLGPARRRDDLLRLLPPHDRARLQARLRAPVGLPLGGQGPEAIAMSIGAQLQAYRHADA